MIATVSQTIFRVLSHMIDRGRDRYFSPIASHSSGDTGDREADCFLVEIIQFSNLELYAIKRRKVMGVVWS
jgi:hypothetical protein